MSMRGGDGVPWPAAGADFFKVRSAFYTRNDTEPPPRRSVGAVGCVVLFAVRVCEVRRRNTHAAHLTSGAIGCHAKSLSAPVTRAFIDIEQASSAAVPAKHSSPRAFRVRGSAVDAPHGNSSRGHVGHSARRHTYTGMRTQRIMGSGGINPTVLRSSDAFLVVHGELGALGARFAPRELQCEKPLFSSGFAFGQALRPISEVAREIADVAFWDNVVFLFPDLREAKRERGGSPGA